MSHAARAATWRAALPDLDSYTNRRQLTAIGQGIRASHDEGVSSVAAFWREAFHILLEDSERRLAASTWPETFKPLFLAAFARIEKRLATESDRLFRDDSDDMRKELAILTLTAVPAGPHIVQLNRSCPRSGLSQANPLTGMLRWWRIQWQLGRGPIVRIHVQQPMIHWFHEAGTRFSFLIVAEVLRHDARLRGWIGVNWYFDPVVARISPRLAYVRDIPMRAGAFGCRFANGPSTVTDALTRSPTRRALYGAGQYRPQNYLIVWPRTALLRWADQQPSRPLLALQQQLPVRDAANHEPPNADERPDGPLTR